MSIRALSTPRPSVFAMNHREVMFSLEALLKVQVDCSEFFEKHVLTTGISPLRAIKQSVEYKKDPGNGAIWHTIIGVKRGFRSRVVFDHHLVLAA